MKKFFALFLASALLLLSISVSFAEGEYDPRQVDFCNEYVTLRAEPSTKAPEVCKVLVGEVVMAVRYNDAFSHCIYNNQEGYILSRYLANEIDTWSEPWEFRVTNCKKDISLRAFPRKGADVYTMIPKGETVTVYYHDDTYDPEAFVYVTYGKLGGFVKWNYLTCWD